MFEFHSAYKLNFVGLAIYLIETDVFLQLSPSESTIIELASVVKKIKIM